MQIINTKQEIIRQVEACIRQGKTIGFVPTMGALHEGHAALVRRAVAENEVCVVSVFVNPTQFNNAEDLIKYPRNLTKDAELLDSIGVHFLFAPTPEEMYSEEECKIQDLFRIFHATIAIKERTNLKLQRQLLPLRFRENMIDFRTEGCFC